MINKYANRIVYSLNINDIQNVAKQQLNRALTKKERLLVQESIGDYIDWFQAIDTAISKHINA